MRKIIFGILTAALTLWFSYASGKVITVNTVKDTATTGSEISLRDAVNEANKNTTQVPDEIIFAIPFSQSHLGKDIPGTDNWWTIKLTKLLPEINKPVIIDGTSNNKVNSNKPAIEIYGGNVSSLYNCGGLTVDSDNVAIAGLVINSFSDPSGKATMAGIYIKYQSPYKTSNKITIKGNFIGVDPSGNKARSNDCGVFAYAKLNGLLISGNTISGNKNDGIDLRSMGKIYDLGDITIKDNKIGADVTGTMKCGNANGIYIAKSDNLHISDNVISGNKNMGIYLRDSKSCYIKNNKIGVDVVGGARIENGYHGILVMDSKFIEITGKNIISGNTKIGMHISKCVNIVVQGNHVGTDASGIVKIGNKGKGISIKDCIGVTVGGDRSLNEGNIISGNGKTLSHYGLEICGPLFYSKGVRICGNMIGTDISGKNVISNAGEGIYLNNVMDVVIGGPTDVNTSGKSIIGKTGNLISGNQSDGLAIIYSKVVFVLGNYIGTNLAGDAALISNKYSRGIRIVDSPFVWLGNFSKKNEWNLIAGNDCTGIVLADTQHDVISNNYIGVNPNALNKNIGIGNQGEGIHIDDWGNTKPGGSRNNYIVENRIAYNDGPGVSIWGNNSRYNLIWRNRFWANKNGLSIDLNNDGVTQNRPKGTAGPNDYLNFPVIESVTAVYDETTNTYLGTIIRGLVSNNCVVDLYKVDDTVPSKQGYGEGKEPLGFAKTTVSTPSIDEWEFMVTGLTENDTVSAIAIDPLLNTSEFCQNTKVKLQKVKSP